MDFTLGPDLLPNLAHSISINRKFEEDNEQELAVEYKMFQIQLTNALWHKTSPPSNPLLSSTFVQPQSTYKPLGFRMDNDDEEDEEEEDDPDD